MQSVSGGMLVILLGGSPRCGGVGSVVTQGWRLEKLLGETVVWRADPAGTMGVGH